MRFSPGCRCCVDCTHLPDQLYIKLTTYDPSTSHSFTYDSGSGLWLAAVQIFGPPTGILANVQTNACTGTGTYTYWVYQMDSSFHLTRQMEACSFNPSTLLPNFVPQNSAPGTLSGSNLFGVRVGTGRGTWTVGGTGSCSNSPFQISGSMVAPFSGAADAFVIKAEPF